MYITKEFLTNKINYLFVCYL